MAKNYTLKEAANIIAEGKKKDEILEIGRRFPLLTVSLASVISAASDKFLDFINYMPDHITANKINSAMKADIEETEAEADTDDVEEEAPKKVEKKAPAKKSEKKSEKKTEADDTDYENMSGAKLLAILKEAGRMKDLRAKGFGIKKPEVLAYLEKYPLDEAEAEDETEAEENGKYDGMNAMELFKECKKRGIKAAPKKPAKFYVDLLTKADEAEAEAEDDGDDEDWDEPEEKPAKKAEKKSEKKAPAKVEKKPIKQTKKPEPEEDEAEDDGDDWDI